MSWVRARGAAGAGGVQVFTYADFQAIVSGTTTKVLPIYLVPNDGIYYISDVILERLTDFAGTSITAATVEIGKSGATAKYMAAGTDVFTGAKATAARTIGSNTTSVKPGNLEAAGQQLDCKITTTGANVSALTAGEIAIIVRLERIPTTGF